MEREYNTKPNSTSFKKGHKKVGGINKGDILKWWDEIIEVKWGNVGWVLFGKLFAIFSQIPRSCNEANTKALCLNRKSSAIFTKIKIY